MDPQPGISELLLSVFKIVGKTFLCSDKDTLKQVLDVIDKTDVPKQTRYSEALSNLKKSIEAGYQQGQYDALSLSGDQSEKLNELLKGERDAWHACMGSGRACV